MYLGDFAEDGDLFFKFSTRAFATGVPTTLSGSPVLSVYKDEGGAATEKTTAESYFDLDVDHDSIAGWNNVRIDLSGDAFFATGADYSIVITTGTVDSVNVFGENLANFSIENRSMGQPAGATLADDIAAIKTVGDAIQTETDKLTFTVANQLDTNPLSWSGGTIPTQSVTGVPEVDVTHFVAGIAPTPATTGVPDANAVEFLDTAVVLSNGLPDVNVEDWLGTIVTAATAGRPDVNLAAISASATAANKLEEGAEALAIGTVNDGSASTTVFIITLTGDTIDATDDHYNGRIITFTSGILLQQATDITDYNGSTKAVTCTALTEAPGNGDQFVIS